MSMRKWLLISYDVRDEWRLRRVAQLLEGYGEGLQYSVFRVRLSTTEVERLRWELVQVVAPEDGVLFFPLCNHCASNVSGVHQKKGWATESVSFLIV